jgi:hypothetical protein
LAIRRPSRPWSRVKARACSASVSGQAGGTTILAPSSGRDSRTSRRPPVGQPGHGAAVQPLHVKEHQRHRDPHRHRADGLRAAEHHPLLQAAERGPAGGVGRDDLAVQDRGRSPSSSRSSPQLRVAGGDDVPVAGPQPQSGPVQVGDDPCPVVLDFQGPEPDRFQDYRRA